MKFEAQHAVQWIQKANDKIQEHKDELTELDRKIGDGDHGINMARGFQEAADEVSAGDLSGVPDVLKQTATTVMSKVGGASGPLYGTAFLKMSMAVKDEAVDYKQFVGMIEAALGGIKQRGKSEEGEKTMIDVWSPVYEAMKDADDFDAALIKDTASSSMEATKEMTATKGRASYLKERSKDHLDPGAVSSYYLFEALSETLKEEG
ncbi:dihydroxyacetone kinase subunit L [Halobacillus litoralis]|uniref:dihydroxyacetone kinase subunit DhaL n=1 Tax=Halobacillus litoralis TaxID=45668 RepID=UPI001CD39D70|nr:dihydroxyacetone kinase subunit DhaL [Halobacillus litoralis]MCA0971434.1 dihydroxyacetone kinase subunit L [Halobacillus litoralis]